ncbi:MAG: amidohydrolase [Burkholderiaceae bacterium]
MDTRIQSTFETLHATPELGFAEFKTSAWLAERIQAAGFDVTSGIAGTGIVATLRGAAPGPVVAVRADMDALPHTVDGEKIKVHSCGHDANCTMVLTMAQEIAKAGLARGTLKVIFQPAEETLFGSMKMIEAGVIDDVDVLLGIHLRPEQEARLGQATPALCHGGSAMMKARISGKVAHGARPHLGINAINAAAAAVQAVNAVVANPAEPWSCKVTQLRAGGEVINMIPETAEMALDIRAARNETMASILKQVENAIRCGAGTVGATVEFEMLGDVPGADYSDEITEVAREAICEVLGEAGLLAPIVTPGADDFHRYKIAKPSLKAGFVGLGANLTPGLHDPKMSFDRAALADGTKILVAMVNKLTA